MKMKHIHTFESFLNEAVNLKTKVKVDADFAKVQDLLKDAGCEVHWSAEQGSLLFNNNTEKAKAEAILKKAGWI